ncbi:DNA polymerase/3'-5' exonuclease PolX [bacterium]|nr:MAG: DNA polymerase/3'-5' exonuclease PolX [bacterium]
MPAADRKTILSTLEEIALLLELAGANPFKSRAFANGARTLQAWEGDFAAGLESGELAGLKGVGKGLLAEIRALVETGSSPAYEELRAAVPAGLMDILKIPGLGPKRVRVLSEKLGISSLAELEYACNENRLIELDGFGAKTQEKILNVIDFVQNFSGLYLLSDAWRRSEGLMETLRSVPGVSSVELAGSIRRRKETVKDIDVLVAASAPAAVHEALAGLDGVSEVIVSGDTKTSIRLDNGLQVDLRTVTEAQFPFALHYFTGSKEHNTRLRARARDKGMKLNEYGLFAADESESVSCASESELFAALDLPMIEPELREDLGELEAALEGSLPVLVSMDDLRGALHNHTTYSDGAHSVRDMAEAAKAMGLEYIGLSDHSQTASYAGGLLPDDIRRQHDEIDEVNSDLDGIVILKGIESDILVDGSLDYPDEVLASLDFVVASVHSQFGLDPVKQTERCIRAVSHPMCSILGHPTGRILLGRDGFEMDLRAVIDAAAEAGTAVELNANPHRLDLDWRELRYAISKGCRVSIGADAHRVSGLGDLKYGVAVARKGWVSKADVLNCLGVEELMGVLGG